MKGGGAESLINPDSYSRSGGGGKRQGEGPGLWEGEGGGGRGESGGLIVVNYIYYVFYLPCSLSFTLYIL